LFSFFVLPSPLALVGYLTSLFFFSFFLFLFQFSMEGTYGTLTDKPNPFADEWMDGWMMDGWGRFSGVYFHSVSLDSILVFIGLF